MMIPGALARGRRYLRRDPLERFMEKVSPEPTSGCWLWTGGTDQHGYARFFLPSDAPTTNVPALRSTKGSRAALILLRGIFLTDSDDVLHRCDNPACVNPDHLFVGTALDNVRDMTAKGRGAKHPGPRGERAGAAKLTADDVRTIRSDHASGVKTRFLARRYGVDRTNIQQIVKRKSWAHVA